MGAITALTTGRHVIDDWDNQGVIVGHDPDRADIVRVHWHCDPADCEVWVSKDRIRIDWVTEDGIAYRKASAEGRYQGD